MNRVTFTLGERGQVVRIRADQEVGVHIVRCPSAPPAHGGPPRPGTPRAHGWRPCELFARPPRR